MLRRLKARAAAPTPDTGPSTDAGPSTDTGPAAVHELVRRSGATGLPAELVDRLTAARDASGDPFVVDHLDGVLTAADPAAPGPHLGLPLLERLRAAAALTPETMATLLMADVAARGPEDTDADPAQTRKRTRHAQRFVAVSTGTAPGAEAPAFPAGPTEEWFARTVHPATARDDEYVLVRVLQAREMLFTVMADDVRAAMLAVLDGRMDEATGLIDHATAMVDRLTMLSRVITIPLAGDVRSPRYESFAAVCGPLRPGLREARSDTLVGAVAVAGAGTDELSRALDRLDTARRRWTGRLVARSTGTAPGASRAA